MTKSLGEDRVRTTFNPSANSLVDQIKQQTAALIDLVATIPKPEGTYRANEAGRCMSLAMTHYEDAAMWAVKAATTPNE